MQRIVRLRPLAADYIRRLAPESRRALRAALRELQRGRGDVLALQRGLTGFHRLRSGRHRILFRETVKHGVIVVDCVFAEERSVVYEYFEAYLTLHPELFTPTD